MENLDLGSIITIVLAGITTFLGGFWLKAKGRIKKVVDLCREVYEAGNAVNEVLEDDKITKDEIKRVKKEFKDVSDKFKALIGK